MACGFACESHAAAAARSWSDVVKQVAHPGSRAPRMAGDVFSMQWHGCYEVVVMNSLQRTRRPHGCARTRTSPFVYGERGGGVFMPRAESSRAAAATAPDRRG